jgi:hypothetical protein
VGGGGAWVVQAVARSDGLTSAVAVTLHNRGYGWGRGISHC